jgi:ribonuclease HII
MKIATFEIEEELLKQGYVLVIGIDEAGRGPLAGPVVACATMIRNLQHPTYDSQANLNDPTWELVRDSKTLSERQREKAFDFIHEHFHVGVGLCNHETIDRINILEASFLAMKKSVQELMRKIESPKAQNLEPRTCILVDGNKQIPNFSMEQRAIVGGDGISKSIAAASIVAKVTRDRLMMEIHDKYPQYGFDKHKGYGTKVHMDALLMHGPCEIHRKSFAPVTRLLRNV